MAIPFIPILMAVAALGSGIVQGISSVKNAKYQAESVANQATDQMTERSRQAKKLMQQQKTSFLKSGIYFDSGTPLSVLNETYDTMDKDVNAMANDANSKINNLYREGKTAFWNSAMQGVANTALSFGMTGGNAKTFSLGSSKAGAAVWNWYNKAKGYTHGGFGTLTKNNGLPTGNNYKIV
ncbi:MAG: hypothetical protein SPL73_05730 [Cyanobacteriota bacterium]|nr:hypothetical protein [Cyanobacteriota bacterium]MDY6364372.1 hypothetical protein [Cyanobacteriota bacterium]